MKKAEKKRILLLVILLLVVIVGTIYFLFFRGIGACGGYAGVDCPNNFVCKYSVDLGMVMDMGGVCVLDVGY